MKLIVGTKFQIKLTIFIFGPNFSKKRSSRRKQNKLNTNIVFYIFQLVQSFFFDSIAATQTLKLSTTLLSISCGIRLISFLMMSSLVCGLFSQTLSFRYPLRKQSAGLRSWEQDGHGLSVCCKMSLSHGKLCLRYSSVLFKK